MLKIVTTQDQEECKAVLRDLEILDVLKPRPGREACDGVTEVGPRAFIVASYDRGSYAVALLTDATQKDAFDYLATVRPREACDWKNPRMFFTNMPAAGN